MSRTPLSARPPEPAAAARRRPASPVAPRPEERPKPAPSRPSEAIRSGLQGALVIAVVLVVLAAGYRVLERVAAPDPASPPTLQASAGAAHPSFLYGRVTTVGGTTYEGRLRFGGSEEALWGHYFNGVKKANPWAPYVPADQLPGARRATELFGLRLPPFGGAAELSRPFMARFGDIARIDAIGDGLDAALERGLGYAPELRVTLKSGAAFDLDRFSADDFADGVRVWDAARGVVDLPERRVRSIEFLPPPKRGDLPDRLHGTVHTRRGTFTGLVQWNREKALGDDALVGHAADGPVGVPFGDVRSVERRGPESALVTLRDGRTLALSGAGDVGRGHRGLYVDDPRYGRVLVSWEAFDRADLGPADSAPTYDAFPAGGPLHGRVTTTSGDAFEGRLVFDLDESETTETLDAPAGGVDYTVPFGLVASVERRGGLARVTLHTGEELRLERAGDLGDGNAGLLVFTGDRDRPVYVAWADVARVAFDRPPATYPPATER